MGITKDNETPAMLAGLIQQHHLSATFRLRLVRELLLQLHDDFVEAGFPTAAIVMDLADSAAADVEAPVGAAADQWLAQRLADAAERVRTDDSISLADAVAAIVAGAEPNEADRLFAVSQRGAYWVGVREARRYPDEVG